MPEPPKHLKPKPIEPSSPKPLDLSPPPVAKPLQSTPSNPEAKSTEPIFVRIDKFQSAQKNFEQIKDRVSEIDSVLKKLKDVKSQEEVELKGWTEDIEQIKSKLSQLDEGIFNQI